MQLFGALVSKRRNSSKTRQNLQLTLMNTFMDGLNMDGLGAVVLAILLIGAGLATSSAVQYRYGTSLSEDHRSEVVGKLASIEIVSSFPFDSSLILLEDGTRINVKGTFAVYRPGSDVVTSENSEGVFYCLADLCRYRND